MRLLILLGFVAFAHSATAQTPGSCVNGTAQADLGTSQVFARLFNTGALFFGNQTNIGDGYRVPRARGLSSVFAAAFWVGGTVNGEVRTAAARYQDYEFFPGPLNPGATLPDPASCAAYDRIYVVSPDDVAAYQAGGMATADLAEWPVGLGAPAVDAQGQPVPVGSREQRIDLPGGERPVLRGGPTAFWVMNDVGGPHVGGNPLGVEVQVTAFATTGGSLALRQSTVYRYNVINRSAQAISGLHTGFYVDTDLGNSNDDYVGTDVARGMAYTYNGAPTDSQYGVPPALGLDLLSGLWSAMTSFDGGPTDDPDVPDAFYFRLKGLWNDGTPMRAAGYGYGAQGGAPVTRFIFNGDPVRNEPWSQGNPGGGGPPQIPEDRRLMLSAPAVTLAPGASTTVDLAIVFGQGTSNLNSVTALRAASDAVQAAYDAGALFPVAGDAGPLPAGALALGAPHPNPARGDVRFAVATAGAFRLRLVDVLGRTVLEQRLGGGTREARLDVRRLAPGTYAVVLDTAEAQAVRMLTVVR